MRRKRRQHRAEAGNVVVRHWVAPFVLAMLVLRSLVPAGFMLAPVDGGGLAVVLCDADATVAMYGHTGHDMTGGTHDMSVGDMPSGAHNMSAAAMGGGNRARDMSMPDMLGQDMSGHPGGHTHPDPTCPFAQSSGATPLPFLSAVTPAIPPGAPALPALVTQTHAHFGPARQQSPRGPPRLG